MISHGFQGQQESFPLRYFQSQERLLNWSQVFCGKYIPFYKGMYVRLAPTANFKHFDTLVRVVRQRIKSNLTPRSCKHGAGCVSFFLFLASKAHERLYVFGLGEHIIRLNFFNRIIPRQGLFPRQIFICGIFNQFPVPFNQSAR